MSSKVKLHVMRNRVPFVHFGSSARQFYQASLKVSIYFYSSCHFLLKAVLWTLQSLSSSHINTPVFRTSSSFFFYKYQCKKINSALSFSYLFIFCPHEMPAFINPCHPFHISNRCAALSPFPAGSYSTVIILFVHWCGISVHRDGA